MKKAEWKISYEVYENITELNDEDRELLQLAQKSTGDAYAPYSHFHVGAAARLNNGEIIRGSNQENASFPVGLCAERVLLSAASSRFPGEAIHTIAVSYDNRNDGKSSHPIAPCGVCRQTLQEFEQRTQSKIRLILGGREGNIYILDTAAALLPLAFTKDELVNAIAH